MGPLLKGLGPLLPSTGLQEGVMLAHQDGPVLLIFT